LQENNKGLLERFFMREYFAGINQDIVASIPKNSVVLDVGCADGKLGWLLKKEKNCIVFGVELNKKSAKKAKKVLDKVFCINLESKKPNIEKESFDVIIFADVLEHFKEPEKVLKKLSPLLKQRGKIIVSVPNVANFFIRKDLLFGNFNYADEGILDKNHLRFFTLKGIKRFLSENGYKIIKTKATRNALRNRLMQKVFQKVLLGKAYATADYFIANAWKSLFAQQFVVLAEKVK
jgi:methionine biosynthesis protein MetW